MIYESVEDKRVYLYNEHDHELEVDLALMDDGICVGTWLDGPDKGEEIELSHSQIAEARELGYEESLYE